METIYNAGISINKKYPAHQLSKTATWSSVADEQKSIKAKEKIINQWPQPQKGYQINKAIKAASALKHSQSRLI